MNKIIIKQGIITELTPDNLKDAGDYFSYFYFFKKFNNFLESVKIKK